MTEHISELVKISSPAFSQRELTDADRSNDLFSSTLGQELLHLLSRKNGFFAFAQALEVYPFEVSMYPNLVEWNSSDGWRKEYDDLENDLIFFAQDIFGVQFCISGSDVSTFDPETGQIKMMAKSLNEWAALILKDYNYLTGCQLAYDWQSQNGKLAHGERLVPKIPFVAGGTFTVDNLYALDCSQSMSFRASIANQIKNLPDGATIQIRVT